MLPDFGPAPFIHQALTAFHSQGSEIGIHTTQTRREPSWVSQTWGLLCGFPAAEGLLRVNTNLCQIPLLRQSVPDSESRPQRTGFGLVQLQIQHVVQFIQLIDQQADRLVADHA